MTVLIHKEKFNWKFYNKRHKVHIVEVVEKLMWKSDYPQKQLVKILDD